MAEVKKVATRVSYGEALVELGNEHDDFVVLDATWLPLRRRVSLRLPILSAFTMPASPRAT